MIRYSVTHILTLATVFPPAPPRHEYHKYASVCMYVCMRALTYLFAYVQLMALLLQCTYTHAHTVMQIHM